MSGTVLEAAHYWQLRALGAETQRLAQAAAHARDAAIAAQRTQEQFVATLAARYGFDPPVAAFTLDDDTLTLTIPDSKAGPA